jgi:hypothetical protein
VLCGERALEQLKEVIPPDNLISRLGGNSEYDPCVNDLGFPVHEYTSTDISATDLDTFNTSNSLKAETRHASAESTLTTVSMETGLG